MIVYEIYENKDGIYSLDVGEAVTFRYGLLRKVTGWINRIEDNYIKIDFGGNPPMKIYKSKKIHNLIKIQNI